jgi:hypothetical protein
MTENLVTALLAIIASFAATVVSYLFSKQNRHERKARSVHSGEISVAVGPVKMTKFYGGGESEPIITSELVKRMEEQVLARVQSSPGVSRQEVQKEVKAQVAEIQDRIVKIENRFPDEAKLDKVASINDALLSERIDQLSKQVENLENKMLSHWDVAVVVGGIITGIIAIVGATYGVLKATGVIP